MAELTYLQAISDGLRQEMRRDNRVFVIEDVGVYGGAFKVTLGFQEEFGPWRVIDAPLSETAIVGGCTGAAIMGMRPVAEMQFADFISCAWDQLVTVAAKQFYRAGTPVPIVVRLPSGGGFSGGPFHSQNPELVRAHRRPEGRLPGDARGRQGPADQRDRGPEPRPLLRAQAPVPPDQGRGAGGALHDAVRQGPDPPRGRGPDGRDLGSDGLHGRRGREQLEQDDVSVEIIDLRTIIPWDRKAVLDSAQKTSKVLVLHEDTRTGGFGGEIAATIAEEAFEHLDAPIKRIAAPDTPVPFSPPLEKAFIPQVDDVVAGLRELAEY